MIRLEKADFTGKILTNLQVIKSAGEIGKK
jgi:hypothetical protein